LDFGDPYIHIPTPIRGDRSGTDMYHHAKFYADWCHRRRDICNRTQKKTETNIPFHLLLRLKSRAYYLCTYLNISAVNLLIFMRGRSVYRAHDSYELCVRLSVHHTLVMRQNERT